jgi:hypothetical protein
VFFDFRGSIFRLFVKREVIFVNLYLADPTDPTDLKNPVDVVDVVDVVDTVDSMGTMDLKDRTGSSFDKGP